MTVKEAAQRIGISASLVYGLCSLGLIRHSRHGRPGRRGTIRISVEAIAEYMAACEKERPLVDEGPLKHIR
jgi:excisionase family DNA binding protein